MVLQAGFLVFVFFRKSTVTVRNDCAVSMGCKHTLTRLDASSAQSRSRDSPDRYEGWMKALPALATHWGSHLLKIPLGSIWKDKAKYGTDLCRGIPVKI